MKVIEGIIEEHLHRKKVKKCIEVAEEMNFARSSTESEQSAQNKQYYSQ